MRRLVTGIDASGKSCIVKETELAPPSRPVDVWSLFRTHASPPPTRPAGRAEARDLGVAPGDLHWVVSRWEPGSEAGGMHHTDTLDLDIVLEGSVDLLLDDGTHPLEKGDCVIISGVDHGWRAGPDGCTLSVVLLGTPPSPDS